MSRGLPPMASAQASAAPRVSARGGQSNGPAFRRAVLLMLMTLVLPGSAQLVAGRKQTGRIAMRIWLRPDHRRGAALRDRPGLRVVRLLAAEQHRRARLGPDPADGDGRGLGLPLRRRLAPRRPARAAAEAAPGHGRAQRRPLLQRRRLAPLRLPRGGGAEGLHERDVRRRRRHRRPRRPLQRAAARRRLRLRPLGPATGQPRRSPASTPRPARRCSSACRATCRTSPSPRAR